MCTRTFALVSFLTLVGPSCTNSDNFALLLDTLKDIRTFVCDEEVISLTCPPGTQISILVAQYGGDPPIDSPCRRDTEIRCKLPNQMQYMLLQRVVEACQKKVHCTFSTNPSTPRHDDPCPNSRKFVEVSYKCRPYDFRSLDVCDEQIVKVNCKSHSRIAIFDVNYGRTAYETVPCAQPTGVYEETCHAPYAVEKVRRMCHGKRRCQFVANRKTFNATCSADSRPYVKVIYACVPLGVLSPKYESLPENDEVEGGVVIGNGFDDTGAGENWHPVVDNTIHSQTETNKPSSRPDDLKDITAVNNNNDQGNTLKHFIYIGAGVIIVIVIVLIIIGLRCYFTEKAKENAKNGNMFTTEAPNIFSDAMSDLDNDVEVSHISGTFYDPVHPDMILYRDADGTRNTLRAMKPLSTVYPCAGARMYGNADYVPQPVELGRFTRSKSNEEEGDPDLMTSPKSLSAYSTSRFYYG